MGFVLDASVTLSWCFKDENGSAGLKLLDQLGEENAVVPAIWALEVGNILTYAEKKGRISYADLCDFIQTLSTLPIIPDEETFGQSFTNTLQLARSENLTTYDAAYLELATRKGLPLATFDKELRHAAKKLGVHLLVKA